MVGTLIASLVAAYALTSVRREPWLVRKDTDIKTKQVRVGDLSLAVPESLELNNDPGTIEALDHEAIFSDPATPERRLRIGEVRTLRPRTPLNVLGHMADALLSEQAGRSLRNRTPVVNFFRIRGLAGATHLGLVRSIAGNELHLVTVLTEDGRRYWVVHLHHVIEQPSLVPKALAIDRRLMERIVASSINHHTRDARAEDFAAVGLGLSDPDAAPPDPQSWLPEPLMARIALDHPGQEPILLVPHDAAASVRVIRIRGVIDAGGDSPSHPLWPERLLSQQFTDMVGRSPTDREIWRGQVADTQVWCLVMPMGTLRRHLCYARLGGGRGVLLEVLSEPKALKNTVQWISPLLVAIKTALGGHGNVTPEDGPLSSATRRGRLIAQRQWAAVDRHAQQKKTCYLVEEDGRVIGGQVEHIWRDDEPPPLQGQAMVIRTLNEQQIQVRQRWHANEDGLQFRMTTQWVVEKPDQKKQTLNVERMRLQNGSLILERLGPHGRDVVQWSVQTPEAFVPPMAEEAWPGDLDSIDEALIWMTRSRHQPRPYWVSGGTGDHDQTESSRPVDDTAPRYLLLRPAMSLDADRLTYDADGLALTYHSKRLSGWGRGAAITARRVDRREAIETFPTIESEIQSW